MIDKALRITPKEWYDLESEWKDECVAEGLDF